MHNKSTKQVVEKKIPCENSRLRQDDKTAIQTEKIYILEKRCRQKTNELRQIWHKVKSIEHLVMIGRTIQS